jgi:hypothetical protein
MSNWKHILSALIIGAAIVYAAWVLAAHSRYSLERLPNGVAMIDRFEGRVWIVSSAGMREVPR